MSKLSRRLRNLRDQAVQVRNLVQAAPQQAAQLRESVLMTAGQLAQLRAEVQSTIAGVHVDSEERLAQVVREIRDHQSVFAEAGYELSGVEIEFNPIQRVIVRLNKVEETSLSSLRALSAANQSRATTHALLSAITKAEELAPRIEFPNLSYSGLVVTLSGAGSVRICWSAEIAAPEPPAEVQPQPGTVQPTPTSMPSFGASQLFPARATPPPLPTPAPAPTQTVSVPTLTPAVPMPHPAAAPTPEPAAPSPAAEPVTDWRQNALDRFKKMPSGSKYRR